MRIVFGIMSAVHRAGTIAQLAEALAPHEVVIHHDFTQQPDFEIRSPRVRFVAKPKRTGWACWGFSEGIFHLVDDCLRNSEFDYFQLLSPTCLPIRTMDDFETFARTDPHDAHIDAMSMDDDTDVLTNYGWRSLVPEDSIRYRVMRKAYGWYQNGGTRVEEKAGLSVYRPALSGEGLGGRVRRQGLYWMSRAARAGLLGANPFSPGLTPFVGSTWFGARPKVCQYLVKKGSDPEIVDYFSRIHMADEVLFATLLHNSGFRVGQANHVINTFAGAQPRWIEMQHLPRIMGSGKYFARKFVNDPQAPVRQAVIERVGRVREAA